MVHVEVSQVVPPLDGSLEGENMDGKVTKDITKESQSEELPEKDDERVSKILEKF